MNKESFYKNMLDNIYDGVYFVNSERKIEYWNKGAERISGYKAIEVVGHFCYNNILNHIDVNGSELCLNGCPLQISIKKDKVMNTFVYLSHKNGQRIPVTVKTIPLKEDGKIIGAIEIFKDESKESSVINDIENLKELSLKDQLTQLPNRRYIDNYLISRNNELKYLKIPFGVLFMDIDHFKNFNDSYGHDTGDEVLKMIAKVFKSASRSNDLIGRWGGEEFIGVFSGVSIDSLYSIAEKIRILIEKSYIIYNNKKLKVTISIGASMAKQDETIKHLIARADELVYKSKEDGRNRVSISK